MARFYGNENFSLAVVKVLRELGHSVTTESGMANQAFPDVEVLRYATHAGIIVCTYDPDAAGQAEKIHLAVADVELSGRVLRIHREGFRLE